MKKRQIKALFLFLFLTTLLNFALLADYCDDCLGCEDIAWAYCDDICSTHDGCLYIYASSAWCSGGDCFATYRMWCEDSYYFQKGFEDCEDALCSGC
jgi:hypothetical protein